MPAKSTSQRNLLDQIDELKRKIQLIEGEKQAYEEAAAESIKQNQERISELRRENDDLRKENAEKLAADEKVIKAGLKQSPEDSKALRSKPGDVAIVIMDEKVRDRMNALNALRHVTRKKQAYLDSLKKRQQQRSGKAERGGSGRESDREERRDDDDDDNGDNDDDYKRSGSSHNDDNESEEAQAKRSLENRLDKSNLKCKEAEHIQRTYQQIKAKLEDEQQTFEKTLDELEAEIQRLKHQQSVLSVKHDDAHLLRDKAKQELSKLETDIQQDRRRRENELEALKLERMDQDHNQRKKAARLAMGQDAISDQKQVFGSSDDDQELMMMYELSFKTMKHAAGVSDTRKLVQRFREQGEKQKELKDLMEENDRKIEELTDRKEELQQKYDVQKYTGEEALTNDENLVRAEEECAGEEERKREDALEELEKRSHLLTDVKSGLEHLVEKLKGFREAESEEVEDTAVSLNADEYLLHHVKVSDQKLTRLMEELKSSEQEEAEMSKKMDDDEFQTTVELKLPAYNTRVKLPTINRERDYDEDNMSGDDGGEILSRQALKKQSQMIIDSKTRRRPNKRRKRIGK